MQILAADVLCFVSGNRLMVNHSRLSRIQQISFQQFVKVIFLLILKTVSSVKPKAHHESLYFSFSIRDNKSSALFVVIANGLSSYTKH